MSSNIETAQARIADCLQLDAAGNLVQRRDHLNLAGLGLTDADLSRAFDFPERGLRGVSLADLPHLKYLDLAGNALTELPQCVAGFTELVWLGLNFNWLMALPPIGALKKLQRLYLRDNGLSQLPDDVGELTQLVELDLHGNRIHALPSSMIRLLDARRTAGLLHLDLDDNGSQLAEVFNAAEEGAARNAALANYLREMQEASRVLAQGKLLLVGEGGVGKTTLLDVLTGQPYNHESDTTHGLELRQMPLRAEEGWDGTLHAWDFSGQPAMRQTHQLFFTTPALYLLVWNHREAREMEMSAEIMEWLTLIDQRTQGEGRVLLVAKKARDRHAEPPHYADMLRRFGPDARDGRGGVLLPNPCYKVDSKCETEAERGQARRQVDELRRRIASLAAQMPAFNERRPESWIKAQQHFQGRRVVDPYLEWNVFAPKCRSFGITDAEEYARAQHRLGTLVWLDTERMRHVDVELAADEPARQLVVLNPDWLSKAVGFVIERDDKDTKNGSPAPASTPAVATVLVSAAQMDAVWSSPPQPQKGAALVFPTDLFPFFRQLMRAFDIARPVRHGGTLKGGWHIVPHRLQESPPPAWTSAWRTDLAPVFWRVELRVENGDPLNHWLGLAIFYRLMIMLHGDAQGRQDFREAAHWRRGFILAPQGGGLARIEFNGSDRRDSARCVGFDIQVASHQPRELWALFAEALDYLIHDLERHYGYASIVVKRLVSCPVTLCQREAARRCYIDEGVIAACANSGEDDWKHQTTICNATDCGKKLPMGLLWDGRTVEQAGSLARIEAKLDTVCEREADIYNEVVAVRQEATRSHKSLEALHADLADIHHRLGANALASTDAAERILNGQASLARGLRDDMERVSEEMSVHLRELHRHLSDQADDLPCFYSLMPVRRPWWSLSPRTWRLWLHCEKTGYPVPLVRNDKQGEFILKESSEFLRTVAPYVKNVSTLLAGLAPVTALLTGDTPAIPLSSPALLILAEWAKNYEKSVSGLAALLKEENAAGSRGMMATGERPILARKEALLWLHNFLRQDPMHRSKLGLLPKPDGQGRRWWVLPDVEV